MKLCKPSYGFGSNQRSFSKYEHQEHKSESSYADSAWDSKSTAAYDSHAHDYVLGRSIGGFNENEANHALGNKSINYYANAQSALPSPAINVQQGHHVMGKMNKHEGQIGQDWGSNSPKYAVPALVDHSSLAMHDDNHMMGGTARPYHVGQSGYKERGQKAYNYNDGGIQGAYASNAPILSSPGYLSPIKTNQSGLIDHEEGHVMGNMDRGWASSASNLSSPTHAPRPGLAMQKGKHMIGDLDHGWDNSTPNFSSPTHAQRSGVGMHEEEHMMGNRGNGWAKSPIRYSSPTQPQLPAHAMYKKEHMMEKDDRGWSNSPSKFTSPPQRHYSSRALPKEEPLMGNMNNGWANSPTKYSRANNFNSSKHNMHGEQGQLGWSDKSLNGFRPNQVNHSAHASYDEHDQCVDEDVHDIMDEILTKYPSHNVSGGHGSSWGAKSNAYAAQNQVGGYAKQQAYGASANYGGAAAQSMASSSSKFALNKQMNAGYSSNYGKHEYSADSRANKFQANSMINSGGYY